ncbi:hypothetical protein KM043_010786 [Ampulex compressa]|nr:hypothetical protein KM043_010786 [Ampulex compressa]
MHTFGCFSVRKEVKPGGKQTGALYVVYCAPVIAHWRRPRPGATFLPADGLAMAEFNIDIGKLPEDVREKLAELDLELSEGE